MSSGQLARTRENFPRMKVRWRRRRARALVLKVQGIDWAAFATGVESIFDTVGGVVVSAMSTLASVAEGMARVTRETLAQWHAYLGSERHQLDLIAHRHQGDPIRHSAAVGDFFTTRALRELDALEARILYDIDLHPWQLDLLSQWATKPRHTTN